MGHASALARIWLFVAGFAAGIARGHASPPVALCLLSASAAGLLLVRRRAVLRLVGLGAAAFLLGLIAAAPRAPSGASALETLARGVPKCRLEGRVLEQLGGLGTLFAAARINCSAGVTLIDAGAVVVEGRDAVPGAPVFAEGWLLPLGHDEFDRARRRAGALAAFDPVSLRFEQVPGGPFAIAEVVRRGLRTATATLERRRAALIAGLTIGDTSDIDPTIIDRFRRAGLSHLVAVSGANVAIVLGAVALLVGRLNLKLRVAFCFVALAFFVLVVGPDPSVVRAAAMGALGLVALLLGRRAEPLQVLGLALLLAFAVRPGLVFSVGLHLSAAATAGLVLWTKPLSQRMERLPIFVAVPFAATLAAQLAVAPIVIGVFGQLSLTGVIANLLVFLAVAPATILGMAAAVVAVVAPLPATLLARLADPFATWILVVADHFGAPTWAALELPHWAGVVAGVPVGIAALTTLRKVSSE